MKAAFPHISVVNPTAVGEPMLLAYFDELLEACRHYDVRLQLISNAMLLRGPRVREMLPLLERMTVSIDGATKETFERLRVGADFDTVLHNMESFSALRREMGLREQCAFTFSVTLMHENIHELPGMLRLAAELEVDHVAAGFLRVFDRSLRSSSPLRNPERCNEILSEARILAKELGLSASLPDPVPLDGRIAAAPSFSSMIGSEDAPEEMCTDEACDLTDGEAVPRAESTQSASAGSGESVDARSRDARPEGWQGRYYCQFPWREALVAQGGEVTPCCSPGRPVMGNAYEQDFMEIWNGPEYQRLRRGLWTGELTEYCRSCVFLMESGQLEYCTADYLHE